MMKTGISMDETDMNAFPCRSSRFRTPAGTELELGVWIDRIGEHRDRLPAGARPPKFRILGLYAAVEIVEGRGFFQIQGEGRREVSSGTVVFVRPQTPCRYWPAGEWLQRFVVWGGPEAARISDLLLPSASLVLRAAGSVSRAYERISPLMDADGLPPAFERRIALELLLMDLLADGSTGLSLNSMPQPLSRALEILASKGGVSGIERLAKRCGVSDTHLRRLFKAHLGMGPKDYAMSLRLSKAKSLLSQGLEIKDVAARCGFADVFHFMRCFKRRVGSTAGSYAKSASPSLTQI